jgi:CRP-like cAMP-binding protein
MESEKHITDAIMALDRFYSPLSAACQIDLRPCLHLRQLERHHILVSEGQMGDKTYFIMEGAARAYYLKDGKDITDWFAFEGEFICPIDSFFTMVPSDLYIETLCHTTLLEVKRDDMTALCGKHPDFDRLCRVVTTKTLLQLRERLVAMQFETASQKLENLVRIRPDIIQRVPLGHIASYLGITLETLSRIRNPRRI